MRPRFLVIGLIGALCLGGALYALGDREPTVPAASSAAATAASVGGRPTDTPFDLRERDRLREDVDVTDVPAPHAGTPPSPAEPDRVAAVEPPPTAVGRPASPTIDAAIAATTVAAQAAITDLRKQMRTECWNTLDRKGVDEDSVEIGFSLAFDAEGHVVSSSVQQGVDGYVHGLERCLGPLAHAVEVSAPGEPVMVSVQLTLP